MQKNDKILITGAGGFIGGHLVKNLIENGYENIFAVDIKPLEDWYQSFDNVKNYEKYDLRRLDACLYVTSGIQHVYNLAADMGGIGYISENKVNCMLSSLINTHMLFASDKNKVESFFFSSSACIYPSYKQDKPLTSLKESDAYPADPEDGYGWEKLFSERMCRHYFDEKNLKVTIARYHNVYGPNGEWNNGREKAPAALCRKIAYAKITGNHEIEIWGDGEQTRSFMYIDDCVDGTFMIGQGNYHDPINLGSSEMVTINQLVDKISNIAGIEVKRKYDIKKPQGVRGRNSDNTLIKKEFNWEPNISLDIGLEKTYASIYNEILKKGV